jgi:DNA-binding response OmpR family regulator
MLSSKDGLFDRARGRIVVRHYLTKPFTKDELLAPSRARRRAERRASSGQPTRGSRTKWHWY